MTRREEEILKIIEENPFVSQNEIADLLDISRSAISAYLNSMYKKGIIKGRGYIITEEKYPVLIGPSHIDIRSICTAQRNAPVYDSEKTQVVHGGPAKNTAECLVGLGIFPKAVFAVASDSFGLAFLSSCENSGIDSSPSVVVNDATSPVYIEMVDKDRHIIAASFSSDNLSTHITPVHLHNHYSVLKNASTITIHDSIPAKTIEYLRFTIPQAKLVLVSSDIKYTKSLASTFKLFDTVLLPYFVASDLNSSVFIDQITPSVSDESAYDIVYSLLQQGIQKFYMILGPTKFCYCDKKKMIIHTSKNPAAHNESLYRIYLDTRDAIAAVLTYCMEKSMPVRETLEHIAAARNIVCSNQSNFGHRFDINTLTEEITRLDSQISIHPLKD